MAPGALRLAPLAALLALLLLTAPSDAEVERAAEAFAAASRSLPAEALPKAALEALSGIHALDLSAAQIARLGPTGLLAAIEGAGWPLTPTQRSRVEALRAAGGAAPGIGWPVTYARLFELSRAPDAEGALAAYVALSLLRYPDAKTPPGELAEMRRQLSIALGRALRHPGLLDALRQGKATDLLRCLGPESRFDRTVIAQLATSIAGLERLLVPELPPLAVGHMSHALRSLLSARDVDPWARDRMRRKLRALAGAAKATTEAEAKALKGAVDLLDQIDKSVAGLAQQAKAEGVAGATAAVIRLYFLPAPPAEGAEEALVAALSHAGLHDLIAQDPSLFFRIFEVFPDEVLARVKPSLFGLSRVLRPDLPPAAATAATVLFETAIRLGTPEEREPLLESLRAMAESAAEGAPETSRRDLLDFAARCGGAWARGRLIGREAPPLRFAWTTDFGARGAYPRIGVKGYADSLDRLKGHVLLLHFFSTLNDESMADFGVLRRIEKRFRGCSVAVVAVTGLEGRFKNGQGAVVEAGADAEHEGVRARTTPLGGSPLVAFSERGAMDAEYGVRTLPHLVLIDAAGIVRASGFQLPEAEQRIEALVAEAHLPAPGSPEAESASLDARIQWALRTYGFHETSMRAQRAEYTIAQAASDVLSHAELSNIPLTVAQMRRLYPVLVLAGGRPAMRERLEIVARTDQGIEGADAAALCLVTLLGKESVDRETAQKAPSLVALAFGHPGLPAALKAGRAAEIFTFVLDFHPELLTDCRTTIAGLANVIPDDISAEHFPRFEKFLLELAMSKGPPLDPEDKAFAAALTKLKHRLWSIEARR